MQLLIHATCFLLFHFAQPRSLPRRTREVIETLSEEYNPWELSGQYEGDIILTMKRNGMGDKTHYWPNATVPYEISKLFTKSQKATIMQGVNYINNKTCIKFRPRTQEDLYCVYISEKPGNGCSSKIGFSKKIQVMKLDPSFGCVQFGVIVHELLHVLGFWHQHSVQDRDDYIEIKWDNIQPGQEYNFNVAQNSTSFGYKYDYESIMHYSAFAFSRNRQKTILPKVPNGNVNIGQRKQLSNIDVLKLNAMYNCTTAVIN